MILTQLALGGSRDKCAKVEMGASQFAAHGACFLVQATLSYVHMGLQIPSTHHEAYKRDV
jgi:hypothetical protein